MSITTSLGVPTYCISFIPFASFVTRHPYFPLQDKHIRKSSGPSMPNLSVNCLSPWSSHLVSFFPRRPRSSRGALKPRGSWNTIFASRTRSTPFSRGPLLASRTNRALPSTLARKPNATRGAYRTTLSRGALEKGWRTRNDKGYRASGTSIIFIHSQRAP